MRAIYYKYIIILNSLLIILFVGAGCSSGGSSVENKSEISTEHTENKITIRNNDAIEREYISKAKIQSIDKVQFEYNLKGKVVKRVKLSSLTYDRNGYLVETDIFGNDGNITFKYNYIYDKSGKRVVTKRFLPNGQQDKKYTYEYNEYGNKVKSNRFNMQDEKEKYYIYKYDNEGNLIEDVWYDLSGKVEYKIEYDYDNGMKTESRSYDSNGDVAFSYIYKYDKPGNIIEETKFDNEGRKAALIQYIYKYY